MFFGRGTMQVSQDVFRFVPLQNFTDESYIDWSKSISEIDTQLYAKYKLSDEEISTLKLYYCDLLFLYFVMNKREESFFRNLPLLQLPEQG